MEFEGEDGSKISIKTDSKTEFGRGLGFNSNDQTVSRRHILFQLQNQNTSNSEPRVSFQVLGKNPVWVYRANIGETKAYKRSEKGEMRVGDSFCVSGKNPISFKLKKKEVEEEIWVSKEIEGRGRTLEDEKMVESIEGSEELQFGSLDVSEIDPVKEFGFLVMGHEFEQYPKARIRAIKNWDWYLEEPRVDSETDEVNGKKRSKDKNGTRTKKDGGYDDEEWTGESEDEKEIISKVRKGKRPRYTTRSKDLNKPLGDVGTSKRSLQKKIVAGNKEEEDEEEDDEDADEDTLGGFIVTDEEVEEEYNDEEEEEEEDFEDEDE